MRWFTIINEKLKRNRNSRRKYFKILIGILILLGVAYLFFTIPKYVKEKYEEYTYSKYLREIEGIDSEDLKILNKVIKTATDKEGLEYIWGGKGEEKTKERDEEWVGVYGM